MRETSSRRNQRTYQNREIIATITNKRTNEFGKHASEVVSRVRRDSQERYGACLLFGNLTDMQENIRRT